MNAVWKKLQVKGHRRFGVVGAPASFEPVLADLPDGAAAGRVEAEGGPLDLVIAFVTTGEEVAEAAAAILPRVTPQTLVWFAYPKKSSKRLTSEIDRDHGWDALGTAGYEPVRQVAIDEDWSALRFRPADQIASMTRRESMKISDAARKRST
jgi:hypothetical protein